MESDDNIGVNYAVAICPIDDVSRVQCHVVYEKDLRGGHFRYSPQPSLIRRLNDCCRDAGLNEAWNTLS
jgi:hypothetical protein